MSETAHKFDPTILREYDIRGVVGTTLHVTASFTFNVNRGIVIGTAAGGSSTFDVDAGRTLTNAGFIANNGTDSFY